MALILSTIFDFLTDPLGLPIDAGWEYLILAAIGFVAFIIAYLCVGKLYNERIISSREFGSAIHWFIRFILFVILWFIAYLIIWIIKLVSEYWIWILCVLGLSILIISIVCFVIFKALTGKKEV